MINTLLLAIVLVILGSFIYIAIKKASVSLTVVITNFVIFLILVLAIFLQYSELLNDAILTLGCKPSYILSAKFYTVFTHLYIHGSIFHLLINMLFLIFIGLPFEERIGSPKFALIYFLSGVFAVLFNSLIFFLSQGSITQDALGIGASGAIFGIICAYAFLYPKDEVAAPLGFILLPRVPIIIVAIVYFGLETLYTALQVKDSVGHLAHLGGAIGGICLVPVLKLKLAKIEKINLKILESLATSKELKELFNKIEAEEIEEVRKVWIEEFLRKVKCPKCNKKFIIKKETAKCKTCRFEVKI